MESKVVELREELFYGNGRHKKCYIHPENENLCIKVPYNDGGKIDLEREVKFVRLLKKNKKDCSILPEYFGKIQTSRGDGYVFELIKDYDGEKSLTLEDYLNSEELLRENFRIIVNLLKILKENLLQNQIITMGLFPENIIFQKIDYNKYRVRIVNDMGNAALIPLEYYSSFFAVRKILRRWKRFVKVVKNDYQNQYAEKLAEIIL